MFKLLDEEVDEEVHRIVHCLHQLKDLNLAKLDDKDGPSLFVGRVESVGTQFFYLIVLLELEVLNQNIWVRPLRSAEKWKTNLLVWCRWSGSCATADNS